MHVPEIDHLVWAVPDFESGVKAASEIFGVCPTAGGQHPGIGTCNALISLSDGAYLEIIGPDRQQETPVTPRPFGIDRLQEPLLAGWAIRTRNLGDLVESARQVGYDPGKIYTVSRDSPVHGRLTWTMTFPKEASEPCVLPFLIDWGTSPHPSDNAVAGCKLVSLQATHPFPDRIDDSLQALNISLSVIRESRPSLIAEIETPAGSVRLT